MRVRPDRQSPDAWYSSLVQSVERSARIAKLRGHTPPLCFELAYRAVEEMREARGSGLTVDHTKVGRRFEDLVAATDQVISESARMQRWAASQHKGDRAASSAARVAPDSPPDPPELTPSAARLMLVAGLTWPDPVAIG